MWLRNIQRRLASSASPTADLYFANACADLIQREPSARWASPTVFETDRAVIVFRHDAGAPLDDQERRQVIFVIDDAIFEGRRDRSLPLWYRTKLALLECEAARRILGRADVVVASSEAVRDALPGRLLRPGTRVEILGPHWSGNLAELSHFDRDDEIRIAYLGSKAHSRDAEFALSVLDPIKQFGPRVRFSIASNHSIPNEIRKSNQIELLNFTNWNSYRLNIYSKRFHICIYPLLDSKFNLARSYNKIIEHAVVGAASIYSSSWPESLRITHDRNGVIVNNRHRCWVNALGDLVSDLKKARSIAAGAADLADDINNPSRQRAFWEKVLR